MRRRIPSLLLASLLILSCSSGGGGGALEQAERSAAGYNVVLITLDTTRADRLGAYGRESARTPNLDALAANGLLVEQAVTVAPITAPAHASILTGLYPAKHGVRDNGEFSLSTEHETIAERLSAEGYATAAFVSAFVLDRRFGLDQGFDRYDDDVSAGASDRALADHVNERSGGLTTESAIRWLESRPATATDPFLLWVHYFDPHQPWAAPASGATATLDPYDAEIAYVDKQIGRLLKTLEKRGQRENSLIVVVGDHGEGLGEHDEETHTLLIYESTMRVPLIIDLPAGVRSGIRMKDRVVSVVDLLPTLLDLLGLAANEMLDGRSLLDVADADRIVFTETLVPWLDHGWAPLYAARRLRDKFILAPKPQYFDLEMDGAELTNLNGDSSVAASRDRLADELAAWQLGVAGSSSAEVSGLDPEAAARLESLGYASSSVSGETPGAASIAKMIDPHQMTGPLQQLDRAKALAAAGRFNEALAEMEGLAETVGDSRTLLGQLARVYARVGEERRAAELLERYLQLRPSTQALVMLAQIRIQQGQLAEAMKHLDAASALDANHGAVEIARGDIELIGGDEEAARQHYLNAGEIDPYRARAAMQARLKMLRARQAAGGS
jgi:arylsulfatase A-like enzyme/predicted negative regulator of RcsB-dependent stress response